MYLRVTPGRTDPARFDDMLAAVPAVLEAIRQLPGCLDVRAGSDHSAGTTISVATFDTREHAQFAREDLGDALARLRDSGYQPEAAQIYEVAQ